MRHEPYHERRNQLDYGQNKPGSHLERLLTKVYRTELYLQNKEQYGTESQEQHASGHALTVKHQ